MLRRLLFTVLAATGILAAQDPPTRAGRISDLTGSVSFEPAGATDWAPASVNRPLTIGDQIYSDSGARASIHVPGTAFRLGDRTAFEFLNLDDQNTQVRLSEGELDVRVRRLFGNLEVDTQNMAFTVGGPGEFRIDTNPDNGQTLITARDGACQISSNNGAFTLQAGQQAVVVGQGASTQYKIVGAPAYDAFDRWVMSRNTRDDRYARGGYVSDQMVGYEDLGEHGTWRSTPDYGEVWVPNGVASGWAPYQDGYWSWVDPWGWSWVDAEPWGFAPFHYGRWAYLNGYWGWCPGPVDVAPVYAPALVAWVGFGAGLGVSVGVGGGPVGWFPLGPRDVYIPPFQASAAFVSRLNLADSRALNAGVVSNVYGGYLRTKTVPVASYTNRSVPGAVMAVPPTALTSARPVRQAAIKVQPSQIAAIRTVEAAPHVAPQMASVLGHEPGSKVARPPAAVLAHPIVARTTPPAAPPPFQRRQAMLSANPGRPLAPSQLHQLAGSAPRPAVNVVSHPRPVTPPVTRAGEPPNATRPNAPQPNAAQRNRSFEPPSAAHQTPAPGRPNQPNSAPQVSRGQQPVRGFEPPAARPPAGRQPATPSVGQQSASRTFEPPAASRQQHPATRPVQPAAPQRASRGFQPPPNAERSAVPPAATPRPSAPQHLNPALGANPAPQHARLQQPPAVHQTPAPPAVHSQPRREPPPHAQPQPRQAPPQTARQSAPSRPHVEAPAPHPAAPPPHVESRPAPPPERKPEKH